MPLHALELVLDDASDVFVRDLWQKLADAGLPSQAHHKGATNAPHLTLGSAPSITPEHERRAAALLVLLLPASLPVTGLAALGTRRHALVLLVAPNAAVRTTVQELQSRLGHSESDTWVPHITLGRRLSAEHLGAAAACLTQAGPWPVLVTGGIRRWNPQTNSTTILG